MEFPRTKFVGLNTLREQVRHMRSELDEVEELMAILPLNHDRIAEELADLKHSVETGQRIQQEQHGIALYPAMPAQTINDFALHGDLFKQIKKIAHVVHGLEKIHNQKLLASELDYIKNSVSVAQRIQQEQHGIPADKVQESVIRKNRIRNYYTP